MLLQDVVEEGGEGDEDAGGGKPEGGGLADARVAGLHLVGLYIDDVVLLEIVIGGVHQTGIIEIQGVDLLSACLVLTNKFYIVAHAIDGEVASLSQCLEDIDLLIADGEHTGTRHFTKDRNLVVGHADGHHGALILIQIGLNLRQDQLLAIGLRQTTYCNRAHYRIFYLSFIIYQIGL